MFLSRVSNSNISSILNPNRKIIKGSLMCKKIKNQLWYRRSSSVSERTPIICTCSLLALVRSFVFTAITHWRARWRRIANFDELSWLLPTRQAWIVQVTRDIVIAFMQVLLLFQILATQLTQMQAWRCLLYNSCYWFWIGNWPSLQAKDGIVDKEGELFMAY